MSARPESSQPCIGIAGLGLIGASLARALATGWSGTRRLGYDADPAIAAQAFTAGYIDASAADLAQLLQQCDLVVLCQPVPALLESLTQAGLAERLPVLCDVASVKSVVLDAADRVLGDRRGRFVGTHPIAGKATSGLASSDARLFTGRPVALCAENADPDAVMLVRTLWQRVGGKLVDMGARYHDEAYASLSHLPQLLTWAYLRSLADENWMAQAGDLAGPGFESFTRLGQSSPELWTGIVTQNRVPILSALSKAADALQDIRSAVESGNPETLTALFRAARNELNSISGTSCR